MEINFYKTLVGMVKKNPRHWGQDLNITLPFATYVAIYLSKLLHCSEPQFTNMDDTGDDNPYLEKLPQKRM